MSVNDRSKNYNHINDSTKFSKPEQANKQTHIIYELRLCLPCIIKLPICQSNTKGLAHGKNDELCL